MIKQFILDLVAGMTLEEKAAQLTQLNPWHFTGEKEVVLTGPYREWNVKPDMIENVGSILGGLDAATFKQIQKKYLEKNRNKIPLLCMADIIHGMKTIFPIPLALSGSFNPELCEKTARVAALESAVSGIHVTFSPMADLVRDPRWGRVMESPGEDPYLNAKMTEAMVKGYQGEDLKEKGNLAACIKHFAAYGAPEGGREYNTVDISKGVLRDFYLSGYKAAVEAKVALVMTAFNTVERIPCTANKWLLRDLLRKEWNFDGVIISDFNSLDEIINHSIAADGEEAAMKALEAGLDIEMMSAIYINSIPKLVKEGKLAEDLVDEAVIRVLELKDKLGLFENPYKDADEVLEKEVLLCKEHRQLAKDMACESAVLLKNEAILPLNKNIKVGIAGPYATTKNVLGGWSGHGRIEDAVSLAEGITHVIGENQVITSMDGELGDSLQGFVDVKDEVSETLNRFKDCDVLIAAVGEFSGNTGEGASRTNLRLTPNQERLIKGFSSTGKPVVTIIFSGRPLDIKPIIGYSDAVIQGWFLGTETGNALADILFGECNPSGRLSMTFPQNIGQVPIYYNAYNTGRPFTGQIDTERYVSRYLDCSNEPLYPFGYGLSYSDFEYSNFEVQVSDHITASIDVTNVSDRAGKEVVQLYIRDVSCSVVRPLKELKGFEKITLSPKETKKVTFTITKEMLKFYDAYEHFVFEAGEFDIMVGRDSSNVEVKRVEFR